MRRNRPLRKKVLKLNEETFADTLIEQKNAPPEEAIKTESSEEEEEKEKQPGEEEQVLSEENEEEKKPKKKECVLAVNYESGLFKSLLHKTVALSIPIIYSSHKKQLSSKVFQSENYEVKGILLSGSRRRLHSNTCPVVQNFLLESGIPVLAICYSAEFVAEKYGGVVARNKSGKREEGPVPLFLLEESELFHGIVPNGDAQVYMYHRYEVESLPDGFCLTARTENCNIAAFEKDHIYCVQFHPESLFSLQGSIIINNFFTRICGIQSSYY
jgi:GMP synthase-like glutamine amidotransferase